MAKRLLPLDAVSAKVGFKRSKIYLLIAQGRFPQPMKIDSATRWVESDIDAWIDERIAEQSNAGAVA